MGDERNFASSERRQQLDETMSIRPPRPAQLICSSSWTPEPRQMRSHWEFTWKRDHTMQCSKSKVGEARDALGTTNQHNVDIRFGPRLTPTSRMSSQQTFHTALRERSTMAIDLMPKCSSVIDRGTHWEKKLTFTQLKAC